MESSAILRSIQGTLTTTQHTRPLHKSLVAPIIRNAVKNVYYTRSLLASDARRVSTNCNRSSLLRVKASEVAAHVETNGFTCVVDAATGTSDKITKKESAKKSTFPNGIEALILEVCDETAVAELKMKVGEFEMHLKRNVESLRTSTTVPSIVSPTNAPPVPTAPMIDSAPVAKPTEAKKPSPAPTSPFANISDSKAAKLAALDASGANSYVIVSSPTVGTCRSGRTLKGKKQPPSCKEGDVIKEGQIIGFLDQFGNELPIRSDVAGEVLKILYKDGEAAGYGDPLVAVLPSFHGIK